MNILNSCFGSSKAAENDKKSPSISDEEILKFENELRQEEAAQGPLVSPLLPLTVLQDEFPESNFALKLELLGTQHNFVELRKCRRDGNCFYRAVAFDLIEKFKKNPKESIKKYQQAWKDNLKAVGYDAVIYEDFSDAFWSYLSNPTSLQEAWETDEYSSNMALMLLRLLTSAHIRSNPDDYMAFIEFGPQDANLQKWCERCVDSVGVDADQVQLIALAKALQIEIVVANLGSGMDADDLQVTEFNFKIDQNDPSINLLYRPGHYDLLYKQNIQ